MKYWFLQRDVIAKRLVLSLDNSVSVVRCCAYIVKRAASNKYSVAIMTFSRKHLKFSDPVLEEMKCHLVRSVNFRILLYDP